MSELVNKRHRETRAAIAEAAVTLFTERGFDAVTMDDIGRAAGVSRRTAYRHFPSKDELVFEHPRSWVRLFDAESASAAVGNGDATESPKQVLLRCLFAVAARVDETASDVLAAYNVYLVNPALRGSHASIDDEWFARFSALLAEAIPEGPNRTDDIAVGAGMLVGASNGLLLAWAPQYPEKSMLALAKRVLPRVLDFIAE